MPVRSQIASARFWDQARATVSGSQLIVVYSVQFQTSFAGAKTIWTNAYSVSSGMGSPWKSSFNSTNLTYTVIAIANCAFSGFVQSGVGNRVFASIYCRVQQPRWRSGHLIDTGSDRKRPLICAVVLLRIQLC